MVWRGKGLLPYKISPNVDGRIQMTDCPSGCFNGKGQLIFDTGKKKTFKCSSCGDMWEITPDV